MGIDSDFADDMDKDDSSSDEDSDVPGVPEDADEADEGEGEGDAWNEGVTMTSTTFPNSSTLWTPQALYELYKPSTEAYLP